MWISNETYRTLKDYKWRLESAQSQVLWLEKKIKEKEDSKPKGTCTKCFKITNYIPEKNTKYCVDCERLIQTGGKPQTINYYN